MKVVIVGGVAGGASAAARLRRLDENAEIILLEQGEFISFANCGLPYYIGGAITDQRDLTLQTPESFYSRFRIEVRTRHRAVSLHPERKILSVHDLSRDETYELKYDKLILSPGAEPLRPPLPGIDHPRVFTLRNIPDTLRIHEFIQTEQPRRALVIGGGYIGLEMAENLVHAGLSVSVAELADHVIGPLDFDAACDVHHYLRQQGLELLLGQGVKALHPAGEKLEVELDNGTRRQVDLVLLSVGVRPDTRLAQEAGILCNQRGAIRVDKYMCTNFPDIYAVGDAVEIIDLVTGLPGYIPLAGPANKQGRIAANNICGIPSRYRGTLGASVLKLFDMTVATAGINERAAKAAGLEYDKVFTSSASHATYYPGAMPIYMKVIFEHGSGRILGAQLVGFEGVEKRCDVLATAIRSELRADDLSELELCYAPPFSSAKDPVNMAGFIIENIREGHVQQHHWHDVPEISKNPDAFFLDTRTNMEFSTGHIDGAVNIPLDELRSRLEELDPHKTIYVNCQSGLRSYIACRILSQHGFACSNLSGGYRLYESVTQELKK